MLQPFYILYPHTEWDLNEKGPNSVHRRRLGQMCLDIGMSCLPPASHFQSNSLACLGRAIGHQLL